MSLPRTVLLATAGFVAVACHGNSDDKAQSAQPAPEPPSFIEQPVLAPNPEPAVPLAAVLTLETDRPTRVELRFDDGIRQWSEVVTDLAQRHEDVPVLGMRPLRTHRIEVVVCDADGREAAAPQELFFTTPGLPVDFPPIQVSRTEPLEMEPGVTLLNVMSFGQQIVSYIVIVDHEGEVVWYFDCNHHDFTRSQTAMAHRAPNGNLLVVNGRFGLYEIDMLGRIQGIWLANRLATPPTPPGTVMVDTDTMHHDIVALPPGTGADFVTLSSESRMLANYPASVVDPLQTSPQSTVIADVIVEFDRDGTVVREISLFDVLDPYRVVYDSLGDFWNPIYQGGNTEDWTHGNAIWYDASDDSYIVSVRHQDAVVKIDRQGELLWILGDPARWEPPWSDKLLQPVGAQFEWPFHQHAPEITPQGTIMMFDNGNHRAIPPAPPLPFDRSYSRAVEYRVDEQDMTVEQVWAYGGLFDPGHQFFSSFLCDANMLPQTGNVLVVDGGRTTMPAPPQQTARVAEVTHEVPPRVVFELWIRDTDPVAPRNWSVYRGDRLPSVYPR